ncbi:2-oxoacid:ferredoxin oxidoreductase subunit beta [Candidatus Gottesmanbacteria bacterium]|nr:2-oxoacid:ferredoxin oxidoreductase subunit beta [Candidatus Gottesmanbacteria bacterium]
MVSVNNLKTKHFPTWCPGCGNYSIWTALQNAIVEIGLRISDFVLVYGIGCHGNMFNTLNVVNFETLHGRPIPVAEGIKLANNRLQVIVIAGDGDTLGEGTNHLIHAARRNIDITVLMHDNQVYGLTTGQTSPTSAKGFKSRSTPLGVIEEPINPVALAIAGGASFVARSFAGDILELTKVIIAAIKHRGFSFVDILQPCVTFNSHNSYQWYRQNIYKLPKNYKMNNKIVAFKKSLEWEKKIPVGIFYRQLKSTYEEETQQFKDCPLISSSLPASKAVAELLDELI